MHYAMADEPASCPPKMRKRWMAARPTTQAVDSTRARSTARQSTGSGKGKGKGKEKEREEMDVDVDGDADSGMPVRPQQHSQPQSQQHVQQQPRPALHAKSPLHVVSPPPPPLTSPPPSFVPPPLPPHLRQQPTPSPLVPPVPPPPFAQQTLPAVSHVLPPHLAISTAGTSPSTSFARLTLVSPHPGASGAWLDMHFGGGFAAADVLPAGGLRADVGVDGHAGEAVNDDVRAAQDTDEDVDVGIHVEPAPPTPAPAEDVRVPFEMDPDCRPSPASPRPVPESDDEEVFQPTRARPLELHTHADAESVAHEGGAVDGGVASTAADPAVAPMAVDEDVASMPVGGDAASESVAAASPSPPPAPAPPVVKLALKDFTEQRKKQRDVEEALERERAAIGGVGDEKEKEAAGAGADADKENEVVPEVDHLTETLNRIREVAVAPQPPEGKSGDVDMPDALPAPLLVNGEARAFQETKGDPRALRAKGQGKRVREARAHHDGLRERRAARAPVSADGVECHRVAHAVARAGERDWERRANEGHGRATAADG
ncbi:hypothetical protein B0H10DRAFT_1095247 [Mycena sp. CBHHK59/15]|nr:hypothetical protein B0H10DRAFT_1095247 [Mycena sp. CBHHK59/15]